MEGPEPPDRLVAPVADLVIGLPVAPVDGLVDGLVIDPVAELVIGPPVAPEHALVRRARAASVAPTGARAVVELLAVRVRRHREPNGIAAPTQVSAVVPMGGEAGVTACRCDGARMAAIAIGSGPIDSRASGASAVTIAGRVPVRPGVVAAPSACGGVTTGAGADRVAIGADATTGPAVPAAERVARSAR